MFHAQNCKTVTGLAPISLNSAAATALTVDTLGYAYAVATVQFGVIGGAATVFKIQESESDFSGSNITAFTGSGTTGNLRLPQTSDAGLLFEYHVHLRKNRMRYLQFAITTGATTLVSVTWKLWRADQMPSSNTDLGLAARVIG